MRRVSFATLVSALSLGGLFLIVVIVLVQNRDLSKQIKAQTDINQRFLRCILLIERDKFAKVEDRVAAIDKCTVESRLPNGEQTKPSPTTEDKNKFEKQSQVSPPSPARAVAVPQTEAPQEPPKAVSSSTPPPAPQSVTDRVQTLLEPLPVVRRIL